MLKSIFTIVFMGNGGNRGAFSSLFESLFLDDPFEVDA